MNGNEGLILWTVSRTNRRGYIARQTIVSDGDMVRLDGVPTIRSSDLGAIRRELLARGFRHRVAPTRSDGAAVVEFWM
jgi:hypothetical protein